MGSRGAGGRDTRVADRLAARRSGWWWVRVWVLGRSLSVRGWLVLVLGPHPQMSKWILMTEGSGVLKDGLKEGTSGYPPNCKDVRAHFKET